jgi:hypothetical protein
VDCRRGHDAVLTSYRAKVIDTILGPVTLRRVRYHCEWQHVAEDLGWPTPPIPY